MTDTSNNHPTVERRGGHYPTLLTLLTKNQESHQQTLEKLGDMSAKLHAHIDNEPAALSTAVAEGVKTALAEAFPGGDAAAHRKVHEDEIESDKERRKTIRTLVVEVLKGLATAFVVWAGYAMWTAFLKGPP